MAESQPEFVKYKNCSIPFPTKVCSGPSGKQNFWERKC